MKKYCVLPTAVLFALCSLNAEAGPSVRQYTEAADLTITGKLMDTPNPYHRIDTVAYRDFTPAENKLVRESSGLAVAFATDSRTITVMTDFGYFIDFPGATALFATAGYDLYIKKGGRWVWAAARAVSPLHKDEELTLISDMAEGVKECLMYLPLFSEEHSIKIGTDSGSMIEASPDPFRHRVGIFGSSYTHGTGTSRAGLAYPAQFSRLTGIQLLSIAVSGNCKLQQSFAKVLADAEVDALIFDAFSNPNGEMIRDRLFPFIETVQAAHPGIPLIFQRTIRREGRNFQPQKEAYESYKIAVADSMMKIACRRYKDVYYISPDAEVPHHDGSVDGVHPTDYGYTLWAESIRKPVMKILRRYGIR